VQPQLGVLLGLIHLETTPCQKRIQIAYSLEEGKITELLLEDI